MECLFNINFFFKLSQELQMLQELEEITDDWKKINQQSLLLQQIADLGKIQLKHFFIIK